MERRVMDIVGGAGLAPKDRFERDRRRLDHSTDADAVRLPRPSVKQGA